MGVVKLRGAQVLLSYLRKCGEGEGEMVKAFLNTA
jgi:hypothetical protein